MASVAAVIAHLVVLYLPGSATPPLSAPGIDKVIHVGVFGVPMFLVGLATRRPWLVAVCFAAHGVFSEVLQALVVPGRSGDPWDLVFDLLGIGVALALLRLRPSQIRSAGPTGLR